MPNLINRTLSKLAIAHRSASEQLMAGIGLHSGQANVLFALWREDGQSQAGLRRILGITPPTVNVLVGKLEAIGFVECRNCSKDKRVRRVYLTQKGMNVKQDAEEKLVELEERLLKGFSEMERHLAELLIERLNANLDS